ncbi:MAG: hypothetical protein KIH69_004550 [Anaerolineae bacterium]|nr:hypothetical protein [Anaerolineae bacterium]
MQAIRIKARVMADQQIQWKEPPISLKPGEVEVIFLYDDLAEAPLPAPLVNPSVELVELHNAEWWREVDVLRERLTQTYGSVNDADLRGILQKHDDDELIDRLL